MNQNSAPFAISEPIDPRLQAVLNRWRSLLRGGGEIPFADDLSPPHFEHLGAEIFLLEVFGPPERFRLNEAHVGLDAADKDRIIGKFIDEVHLHLPFELLRAQASATVETMRPTLYAQSAGASYDRLLLPAWDSGSVRLLLGAVARHSAGA